MSPLRVKLRKRRFQPTKPTQQLRFKIMLQARIISCSSRVFRLKFEQSSNDDGTCEDGTWEDLWRLIDVACVGRGVGRVDLRQQQHLNGTF